MTTFEHIQHLMYCSAVAIIRSNGGKINFNRQNYRSKPDKPAWATRLVQKKIDNIRSDIAVLIQRKNGNRGKRVLNKVSRIRKKYRIHTKYEAANKSIDEVLDTAKQKLGTLVKRLQRYTKCLKRKTELENNNCGNQWLATNIH
jgi:hypothetical protein